MATSVHAEKFPANAGIAEQAVIATAAASSFTVIPRCLLNARLIQNQILGALVALKSGATHALTSLAQICCYPIRFS